MNTIERTTKVADQVLREIEKMDALAMRLVAYPYVNGWERGWTLVDLNIPDRKPCGVTFAENSNSDDIVVYVGTVPIFGLAANPVTEEIYAAKLFHLVGAHAPAARTVIARLRELKARAGEIAK